jgi:hypothetical protein
MRGYARAIGPDLEIMLADAHLHAASHIRARSGMPAVPVGDKGRILVVVAMPLLFSGQVQGIGCLGAVG